MSAVIASIQAGMPRMHGTPGSTDPMDQPWLSGFFKEPILGPVRVFVNRLDGDGQADRRFHGGADKAMLGYAASHYPLWSAEYGRPFLPGGFGENLTITGLCERDVCIGDRWRIGPTVVVEVSQPRQPCWKTARRWKIPDLTARVVETGRCGWYYRVLNEGVIEAGMDVTLVARPRSEWTVERAHRVMYFMKSDVTANTELAAVPELSMAWREELLERIP